MLVVISYDVSTKTPDGQKRLKRVAEHCLNYGIRVQFSVFECFVDPAQWEVLKTKLLSTYNPNEDSLKFYYLGANWSRRVETYGIKKSFSPEDTIII
jgi:CRISPR-associated protein Cas2